MTLMVAEAGRQCPSWKHIIFQMEVSLDNQNFDFDLENAPPASCAESEPGSLEEQSQAENIITRHVFIC